MVHTFFGLAVTYNVFRAWFGLQIIFQVRAKTSWLFVFSFFIARFPVKAAGAAA